MLTFPRSSTLENHTASLVQWKGLPWGDAVFPVNIVIRFNTRRMFLWRTLLVAEGPAESLAPC